MIDLINYLVFGTALVIVVVTMYRAGQRTARDVLDDLEADYHEQNPANRRVVLEEAILSARRSPLSDPEMLEMGLFDAEMRKLFHVRRILVPAFVALSGMLLVILIGGMTPIGLCLYGICGWAVGYIGMRLHIRSRQAGFKRTVEFFLPLVMERIVMAVQAGLDVIPAIQTVIDEGGTTRESQSKMDPVSKLLSFALRLTERGMGFERSLREIAGKVKCSALRHAFVHLALAQRDGGELVVPLRELSDSTHLYYQESIEEEIAKMPVKATLPLLCTFAGLIICFITAPIVQIVSITQNLPTH